MVFTFVYLTQERKLRDAIEREPLERVTTVKVSYDSKRVIEDLRKRFGDRILESITPEEFQEYREVSDFIKDPSSKLPISLNPESWTGLRDVPRSRIRENGFVSL